MSRDLNRWTGIGRLGKDPELKYMPNGDAVVNFSIACGDDYKDQQGELVSRTEWVNIVAFKRLAEICGQYLLKGSQVYCEGKLRTRKYQTKDGADRYVTEVVIQELQMLGSKPAGEQQGKPAKSQNSPPASGGPAKKAATDYDDDIPFAAVQHVW